jgi:hypothetical protein
VFRVAHYNPRMRLLAALLTLLAFGGQQTYPPPYPRPGTKALIDNERAQIMDTVVVWTEGRVGRALFPPAGTVHTPEPISAGAKATIFELK